MGLAAPTESPRGQLSAAGSFAASSEEQARPPWLSEHATSTADPIQAQQSSIAEEQQGDGLTDLAEDPLQAAAVVDWVARLDFDAYLRWVSDIAPAFLCAVPCTHNFDAIAGTGTGWPAPPGQKLQCRHHCVQACLASLIGELPGSFLVHRCDF